MRIKTSMFCGLARNAHWQQWLLAHAKDLHDELQKVLEGPSCRENKEKMVQILAILKLRGFNDEFEQLIRERFPHLEDRELQEATKPLPVPPTAALPVVTPPPDLNKHGVFKRYQPHLLQFPAQLIILGANRDDARRRFYNFTRNKIGVDWVAVEDRIYLEYFFEQHKDTMDKIRPEDREIAQWRRRVGLADGITEAWDHQTHSR